jgi:NAD(P)-dependent dehydrogenase (short-subunit alcohol dehydrogenase family)
MRLNKKRLIPRPDDVVLTTGANSGIGLVTALELARRGWRSVGSVRSEEKAGIVAKAAAEAGLEVETVIMDVTDQDQCEQVMSKLRLRGLVNCAGYNSSGAISDLDDDEARRALETMALAPMRLARLALPAMVAAGGGRIVNVSSAGGRITMPLSGWYVAAKHALEAASDALRMEVARRNVQVVLIEPGSFKTGLFEEGVQGEGPDSLTSRTTEYADSYLQITKMMKPRGDPARVARLIANVLEVRRPRARYIIGADARLLIALQQLPTPAVDRFYRRLYHLRT